VPIRYIVQGSGPPLVLIHPFGGQIEEWFSYGFLDGPHAEFQFIALDCRGHGKSGKPHTPSAYGQEMVDDVVRLLDHLQVRQAHLLGYSMGAEIALKMVIQYPARVHSVVLLGSGWSGEDEYELYRLLMEYFETGEGLGRFFEAMTLPGRPLPSADEIEEWNQAFHAEYDMRALAALCRNAKELRVTQDEVGAIRVPVLGVTGEFDREKPALERIKGVAPDFTIIVLEGLDHFGIPQSPMLAGEVFDFLRRVDAQGGGGAS
jgi:pimeloyl-ACP methyl ester carboxylesterase